MEFRITTFVCVAIFAATLLSCTQGARPLLAATASTSKPANPSDDQVLQRWTPNGNTNSGELPYRHRYADYELESDSDWVDSRWQQTDWGPFFTHSTEVAGQPARPKNLTLFLNSDKSVAATFDMVNCGIRTIARSAKLEINPARWGLLRKPKLLGEFQMNIVSDPLWMESTDRNGSIWSSATVSYRGLRLHDSQVLVEYTVGSAAVAETLWLESEAPAGTIVRQIEVGPSQHGLSYQLTQRAPDQRVTEDSATQQVARRTDTVSIVALVGAPKGVILRSLSGNLQIKFPPSDKAVTATCVVWQGKTKDQDAFDKWHGEWRPTERIAELREPASKRWREPIAGTRVPSTAADEPYVLDDFPIPHDNPYKALLFCSDIEFFPDGTAAVCTVHGDVWLVRGLDSADGNVTWQRFATGLFQPLGLKIVDGQIIVLENDELTRLHDLNNDGEADWYESFNHDLKTFGQDHAFAMRLETDAEGRFYFLKSGAPPDGSALYRLSKDGSKLERIATGFRHPLGMGIGPDGQITTADNEGNWIPSSKIDLITPGGFYGFVEGDNAPLNGPKPLRPLCYLPKVADNSCGGQVWATSPEWGGYHRGEMIHFSWGRCTMHAVMQQDVGKVHQAATVEYPHLQFTSGPSGAAFNPRDGQMYVVGLKGWQCAAKRDGCLTRVRSTGKPVYMPEAFEAHENGVLIRFTQPLDPIAATKLESYRVNQWNYKWSKAYGSYHYSVANPEQIGHDGVAIDRVRLLEDGKSAFLQIRGLKPVDQLHIHTNLYAKDGHPLVHDIYSTINALAGPMALPEDSLDLPFTQSNLLAWCIVPFDAKHRGPRERVEMLDRLGLHRVAYDWRDEHIPQFDEELTLYQQHNIDLVGFWTPVHTATPLEESQVRSILTALEQHHVRTQLWVALDDILFKDVKEAERAAHAAKIVRPLAEKARDMDCSIALYNHDDWFGQVDHQIAIVQRLEHDAVWNVGIVYNLHHGHSDMKNFPALLAKMRPYLYALNINGMKAGGPLVVTLGQGDDDGKLLAEIKRSGFTGPIGILNHRAELDAETALQENIAGLQKLIATPALKSKSQSAGQ